MKIALLVVSGHLGAAGAAVADCSLPMQLIRSSPTLANYNAAVSASLAEAPGRAGEVPSLIAAHAGHILGRQAQYVGSDDMAAAFFECLREYLALDLAKGALRIAGTNIVNELTDPASVLTTFELALHGALDDAVYREAGIDVTRPVPSIFDSDWSGTWAVEAVSQSVHAFDLAVNIEVAATDAGATVTLSSPTRPGSPQTFPATIDGGTLSFQHLLGSQNTYSWSLTLSGDACTGSLVSRGPSQSLTWAITRCERIAQ